MLLYIITQNIGEKKAIVSFVALLSVAIFIVSAKPYASEVVLLKHEDIQNHYKYVFSKNISYEFNENGDVIVYDRGHDQEYLLPKQGQMGNDFGTLGSYYGTMVAVAGSGASIASSLALRGNRQMNKIQKLCTVLIWNFGTIVGCILDSFSLLSLLFLIGTLLTSPAIVKIVNTMVMTISNNKHHPDKSR